MLERSLIIALAAFAMGFSAATYWQGTLRELVTTRRDLADSQAQNKANADGAQLAKNIHSIESTAMKEARHAVDANARLADDLANGAVFLQPAASCPGAAVPGANAGVGMGDGAGAGLIAPPRQDRAARLDREAEPHYLALREGVRRCRAKLTAAQAILQEERSAGHAE